MCTRPCVFADHNMQFTGCEQPDQCFHWPENAIDWL